MNKVEEALNKLKLLFFHQKNLDQHSLNLLVYISALVDFAVWMVWRA